MLVHIGFPTLFNLKEYWMARSFSRMLFSPAGFAFNLYAAHRSDCVLTTQLKTATIFRKFGVENVTNVLPTYTRFPHKDQYASFFEESRTTEEKVLPTDYVLAIISLARDARLYNYQLRGLDFLCEIAEKLKDIDFVVVGAARADVKEPFKYAHLKNVHLVGAVVDDAKLADIYRRAVCVVCSILAPSFPTRLFEAFFYAKAVISTPVALDCYVGLQDGSNILLATRPSEAADLVRRVFDEGELRARMEANARAYYVKLFSPLAHCRGLEEAYNSCCAHRAKGKVPQTTT
jgi:glycosyltransferase involved in cell wall biosynthesis